MAAVNEVALSVVDLSSMSAAQQNCEDVSAHRAGHHPAKLNLKDHERSPGIPLLIKALRCLHVQRPLGHLRRHMIPF